MPGFRLASSAWCALAGALLVACSGGTGGATATTSTTLPPEQSAVPSDRSTVPPDRSTVPPNGTGTGTGGAATGTGGTATDPGASGGGSSGNHGGGSSGTATPTGGTRGGGAPPPEKSGPEAPQKSSGSGPTLVVASLPVGGVFNADDNDPTLFCGSAHLGGPSFPPGAVIVSVQVKVPPAVTRLSSTCSDAPPCQGFVFTANDTSCDIAVKVNPDAKTGTDVQVKVAGTVECPGSDAATCRNFVSALVNRDTMMETFQVPNTSKSPPSGDQGGGDQGGGDQGGGDQGGGDQGGGDQGGGGSGAPAS